jgi:hypothetical protein
MFAAFAIVMVFGLWSVVALGGIEQGVALLRGQHLYVAQPAMDVGELRAGEALTVEFRVQNLSSAPLTVLGARADCSCITTTGLPLELASRTSGTIQVQIIPSAGDVGEILTRRVELYWDHSLGTRWLEIQARVVAPAS